MQELIWKYNTTNETFNRIIKFMVEVAEHDGIKYKTFEVPINRVNKKSDKDFKIISLWTEHNKEFISEGMTQVKGIKYYTDTDEDDFYKCLYYLGYGDGTTWNCFGRMVLNRNTVDYYSIIIAITKIIEENNMVWIDDYDNVEQISKKVLEHMKVWSGIGGKTNV